MADGIVKINYSLPRDVIVIQFVVTGLKFRLLFGFGGAIFQSIVQRLLGKNGC